MCNSDNQNLTVFYPLVRIQQITIKNFKCIGEGTVDFSSLRLIEPFEHPDMLALYGENGSGKTAVISSIDLLEEVLCGIPVRNAFTNYIPQGKTSEFSFLFIIRCEPDSDVLYDVKLEFSVKTETDTGSHQKIILLFNERLSLAKVHYSDRSVISKGQLIFDSGSLEEDEVLFKPKSKHSAFFGSLKDAFNKLKAVKSEINRTGSLLFNDKTIQIFNSCLNSDKSGLCSKEYNDIINALKNYGSKYLAIVNSGLAARIMFDQTNIIINTPEGPKFLLPDDKDEGCFLFINKKDILVLDKINLSSIQNGIDTINSLLDLIWPGMKLIMEFYSEGTGNNEALLLFTERNGVKIPFNYESEGIQKLISSISLYIAAYQNPSFTFAMDEFDAGIYDFLLGILIKSFQEGGHGQLIFTSHNLSPLELINKKSVIFTTADPSKRFTHINNLAASNNLRDVYIKLITKDYTQNGQGDRIRKLYQKFLPTSDRDICGLTAMAGNKGDTTDYNNKDYDNKDYDITDIISKKIKDVLSDNNKTPQS